MINFASDNASGAHSRIMDALVAANTGSAMPYGDDEHSAAAVAAFKELFGEDILVRFVLNGTGANVLALKALTRPYHAIACAEMAHINVDETGAPENITGCKLLTVPSENGKISVKSLLPLMEARGVVHHNQPRVVSITQVTEMGALYTPDEVRAIADFAHENGMYLHMDGARIANAAAALGVDITEFTRDAGVDVLSFGGAKNGLAFGEAVIFFKPELGEEFHYLRKQNLQLLSKMRYISCQFTELLRENLWLLNAEQANRMAARLAEGMKDLTDVEVVNTVDANMVFASLPQKAIDNLQDRFRFYVWKPSERMVRLVCSFDTNVSDVDAFIEALREEVE